MESFRQQTLLASRIVTQAVGTIPRKPFELVNGINKIWQSDCKNYPITRYPLETGIWLEKYAQCHMGTWPDYNPPMPISNIPDLDIQIERVWQILDCSLQKCRTEYTEEQWDNIKSCNDHDFWYAETDHWIGACVKAICGIITSVEDKNPYERLNYAKYCAKRIEEILKQCPTYNANTEQRIQEIIDILNLPFWKKDMNCTQHGSAHRLCVLYPAKMYITIRKTIGYHSPFQVLTLRLLALIHHRWNCGPKYVLTTILPKAAQESATFSQIIRWQLAMPMKQIILLL